MDRAGVAEWLCHLTHPPGRENGCYLHYRKAAQNVYRRQADAVLALVEAKVREALRFRADPSVTNDEIVARVMGEEAK